jgi:ParB family transcriptional regulator, chromosome partitioning protein
VPEPWQGVSGGTHGRGIGRGLAAILAQSERETEGLRHLPLDLVRPNPRQPRRLFDGEALLALAESIKARGILQPLVVRPLPGGTYELVAGERRLRAARLAGLDEVPAVVRETEEAEQLELALVENVAREDLSPVEEARACATLVEDLGLSKEELGRRIGRSRVAVSNLIRLLDLPDEALDLLAKGELSEGHGRAILMCRDQGERRRLARAAAEGGWSVRETERRAKEADAGEDSAPRPAPVALHPDLADALAAAEDALTAALGRGVRVRPRRGSYRVEVELETPQEGVELAERILRRGRVAALESPPHAGD